MLSWMSGIINPNPWRLRACALHRGGKKRPSARLRSRVCLWRRDSTKPLRFFSSYFPGILSSCAEHGIAMGKGTVFYSEIGKKARDLLTKDYTYDHKFVISTTTQSGLAFTSNAVKHRDAFLGDITTSFRNKNITADVKVDTKSNIITTITVDEFAPGTKGILSFTIPDHNSGKLELQYRQDYAAITGTIGLTQSPIVEATGVVGSDGFAFGGELGFDSTSGNLTKYNAGLSFIKSDFNASLILADKGDTLKASYLHTVSPVSRTTVAAEIAHKISKNENTFTVGGLYELDVLTTAKARLNNHGKLAALVQHEWRPKSLVTVSGEVDTKALDKSAKMGLAISLKP